MPGASIPESNTAMKPDPNKLFHFSPLLPNGSKERLHLMISEVDLMKLPSGRSSRLATVHDALSGKDYGIRGATFPEDHRLVEEGTRP
jgi:hypothetical protein